MKRFILWTTVTILLFLTAGCSTKTPSAPESNQQEEVSTSNEVNHEISVELSNSYTTKEDKWDELSDGEELLVLEVSLTNNLDKDYDFNPNSINVQFDGKSVYPSDKMPKDTEVLSSYTMSAGENISGIICYDVPEDLSEYRIFFDDNVEKYELK